MIIGDRVRLITVLVQYSHYIVSVTKVDCFGYDFFLTKDRVKC